MESRLSTRQFTRHERLKDERVPEGGVVTPIRVGVTSSLAWLRAYSTAAASSSLMIATVAAASRSPSMNSRT